MTQPDRATPTDAELGPTRRARIGRFVGPLVAVVVHQALTGTPLGGDARATAAVGALMATWWITEAVPLPVTSLLPVALFPLTGATGVEAATRPYANEILFLFGGGFVLAQAVQRWGLHRRIALLTVLAVGTQPVRLIGGFMLATAFLSMWVSNTATVVMMLPIGASVLGLLGQDAPGDQDPPGTADIASGSAAADIDPRSFGTALMLAIAYAASIGSVATLIGTPPNGILAGYLADQGSPIGFGRWMLLGLPLAIVFLGIAWLLLTRVLFRLPQAAIPGGEGVIRDALTKMGPPGVGERRTLAVFVVTAALWVTRPVITGLPGLSGLTDASIAIAAAIALFLVPAGRGIALLSWDDAKQIPWGILLLFGGGLALASGIEDTGIAAYIGEQVVGLGHLDVVVLVAVTAVVIVLLTEVTSNTATAAVFIPILAGAAMGLDLPVTMLIVPATLVASFAFMLPVATPPNAIVFASGAVTVADMARAGVWLNIIGVGLVVAATFAIVVPMFGGIAG